MVPLNHDSGAIGFCNEYYLQRIWMEVFHTFDIIKSILHCTLINLPWILSILILQSIQYNFDFGALIRIHFS